MTYKMYIMKFHTTHFGVGNLDSSKMTFSADRLFSSLVIEAKKIRKLDEFLSLSSQDDFVLTDAFPYHLGPFFPKPIGYPKFDQPDLITDVKEVRRQAKKAKKLQFIAFEDFDDYVKGTLIDAKEHAVTNIVTKNQPYEKRGFFQVSTVRFLDDSSLYMIANESDLFNNLMTSLQYSGIGGKRSIGYGRFELTILDIPEELKNRLTQVHQGSVMTLTTSLPIEEDLDKAMEDGFYLLTKSSGFVFSTEVKENYRKQDLFKFSSGSTFYETYKGLIVDVRPLNFPHAVLNYAKPLFLKIEVEA